MLKLSRAKPGNPASNMYKHMVASHILMTAIM